MSDAQIVTRATGVLELFNARGVLHAADVHFTHRIVRLAGASAPDEVLLATAMTVRAVRVGSVCIRLREMSEIVLDVDENGEHVDISDLPWPDPDSVVAALRESPLVLGSQAGPLRPLRLVDTPSGELLYLDRYFGQEQMIRSVLADRAALASTDYPDLAHQLSRIFPPDDDRSIRQQIATVVAASSPTSVIAGGPGTGKTFTVARVLALLCATHGPGLRVALAAPTGRAAAQLQESVERERTSNPEVGIPEGLSAQTIHRLLGWKPGSRNRFQHDSQNKLPHDVVVVDETSMVSLTTMSRLLEALRPQTRLILVGDPDQLASVDAGAVLADIVARASSQPLGVVDSEALAELTDRGDFTEHEKREIASGVVHLTHGWRFGGQISALADAIGSRDDDRVMEILRSPDYPDVQWADPTDLDAVKADVVASAEAMRSAALAGDGVRALTALGTHRLLCAHRDGPAGVRTWSRRCVDWISEKTPELLESQSEIVVGQPILVTANDHEAGIYNGDTGVVIARDGGSIVAFGRGDPPVEMYPQQLVGWQPLYAMTIHRSQGSQYDAVSVIIPPVSSSLLTRELLYTAVTRARRVVRIVGDEAAIRAGVQRKVLRASGLRDDAVVVD